MLTVDVDGIYEHVLAEELQEKLELTHDMQVLNGPELEEFCEKTTVTMREAVAKKEII